MKKHAPATLRNRDAIFALLRQELPEHGTVLEIAAGSGEHAVFFAARLPDLGWLPSDPSAEARQSIAAYRDEADLPNLQAPIALDAAEPNWPLVEAAAIVCINMVHISPWDATEGLFRGAAEILRREGAPLIVYGPFIEDGAQTAQSNLDFDASLRMRDDRWGLRDVARLDRCAQANGLERTARRSMPANNLALVYRSIG